MVSARLRYHYETIRKEQFYPIIGPVKLKDETLLYSFVTESINLRQGEESFQLDQLYWHSKRETIDGTERAVFWIEFFRQGEDQPIGTMFQIFSIIVEHHHDPIMAKLDMEIDVKARSARIEVPQSLRARPESIRNPVTDEEHRILTVLPDGWVFHEGEGAVGHTKSIGDLKFELDRSHSSLAYVAWGPNGVKYSLDEARRRFPLD